MQLGILLTQLFSCWAIITTAAALTPSNSIVSASAAEATTTANSTYYNPVLSGWHSDPSCVHVNGTFFCATSSFLAFPGFPIYASHDLISWRLVSHVWHNSTLSQISRDDVIWNTTDVQGGLFAPTLRYHKGVFYVASVYIESTQPPYSIFGVVFKSADPFDASDSGWSDPVRFETTSIDPDLFWDDDDTLYVAMAGVTLQTLDLATGTVGESISIWNGTGGASPEGPHIYKKDGWYYLMIAEGGTATNHSETVARSESITGPYVAYDQNPVLTNRGTDQYFQTVGHADLFQDGRGNWWGMCLTTRSGPDYETYPMGREAALFPVTWEEGEWPVLEPVRGVMSGWELPGAGLGTRPPGKGPVNSEPDIYDFKSKPKPGNSSQNATTAITTSIPPNLVYPRLPPHKASISPSNKGLRIVPTRSNLTGDPGNEDLALTGQHGIGFLGRPQTHTFFDFSVDLLFEPRASSSVEGEGVGEDVEEEAGVAVFLTQFDHVGLGVVVLPSPSPPPSDDDDGSSSDSGGGCGGDNKIYLRLTTQSSKTTTTANNNGSSSSSTTLVRLVPVPDSWTTATDEGTTAANIRLQISATTNTTYTFSASSSSSSVDTDRIIMGEVPASIVSGGTGAFVGSLVGIYATCNGATAGETGAEEEDCPNKDIAHFDAWRYFGRGQQVSESEVIFT